MNELTVGVYRLVRDVVNPKPDRRQRHDWRAAVTWKAGTMFFVVYMYHSERWNTSLFCLLPHLEESKDPVDVLRWRLHSEFSSSLHNVAKDVVIGLIERGRLTPESVVAVLREVYAEHDLLEPENSKD